MCTVYSSTTSTSEIMLTTTIFGDANSGSKMRSSDALTASALKSVPSWNLTPSRSLNSQVVSSTALNSVANKGTMLPSLSKSVRRSKICDVALFDAVSLTPCGSSVGASAGVTYTRSPPSVAAGLSESLFSSSEELLSPLQAASANTNESRSIRNRFFFVFIEYSIYMDCMEAWPTMIYDNKEIVNNQ